MITENIKKETKTITIPIRIDKSTAKKLKALAKKLNQKSMGRKVKASDIIKKSLSLLNDKDLEEIKVSTYSNADKLEIKYKEHCREKGAISKDEFLRLLLEGLGSLHE